MVHPVLFDVVYDAVLEDRLPLRLPVLILLIACARTEEPALDADTTDSLDDSPVDSDTVDTVAVDSDDSADSSATPPPEPPDLTGGFTDVSAPLWATDDYALHTSDDMWPYADWVVFGDLSGDGRTEMYLGEIQSPSTDLGRARGQVFSWDDATESWVHHVELSRYFHHEFGGIIAIIDLDGDGDDDVVRSSNAVLAELNDGSGNFTPVPFVEPAGRDGIPGLRALVATDFDQDGWLDLIFGPDGCSVDTPTPTLPMIRTSVARWTPRLDLVPTTPDGDAYTLMAAPLGEGDPHLWFVGQECDHTDPPLGFARMGGRDGDGWPSYTSVDLTPPDALYRLSPESAGRPMTLRQPMGGVIIDRDLDGKLDMITALSDPQIHLFHGNGTAVMTDVSAPTNLQLPHGGAAKAQLPWGMSPTDLDADGRPDLLVLMGNDAGSKFEDPYNGPYVPRVFWDHGQGGYADATQGTGLEIDGDWHTVVAYDFDGDLDPDLGLGAWGFLPRVFRNNLELGNHLALRLRGTTSNSLAMGALVHVSAGDLPEQLRVVGEASSPEVFAKPDLHFGVGDATVAREVRITWPAGWTQVLTDLTVDQLHTLEEPPTITLSESDRHLPADGVAELQITVTPRDDAGQIRQADVSIEAPWGHAVFTGPATADGNTWQRTLTAPTMTGSTVIEVTIDGVPMPIRPRVWWDPAP